LLSCSTLLFGDGVDSVDDPREVAEEGEQEADPELELAAELEEDTERGEDDGDEDVDAVRRALGHGAPIRTARNRGVAPIRLG